MSAASIDSISRASEAQQRAVRRAEAFLTAHIDESVPISRLCAAIGVSERCLRKAFHRVRGMSPKRSAVLLRLAVVRRALCHPEATRATVTAIATDHGFFELGRFAGEYKAVFGETPSATLRGAALL
jgi:transcriptional regulator GlxA family with amidase domain